MPTFHLDMTPEERAIMERHGAYWSEKALNGIAIVFGPVMEPKGVYDIGVYQVRDEFQMRELLKDDPPMGSCNMKSCQSHAQLLGNFNIK